MSNKIIISIADTSFAKGVRITTYPLACIDIVSYYDESCQEFFFFTKGAAAPLQPRTSPAVCAGGSKGGRAPFEGNKNPLTKFSKICYTVIGKQRTAWRLFRHSLRGGAELWANSLFVW